MSFYSDLVENYKYIFPVNETTINFLKKNITEPASILDSACGTGSYLHRLGPNNRCIGNDLDQAMIDYANKEFGSNEIEFFRENMINIDALDCDCCFDLVYNIGNSLVHLNDLNDVKSFLHSAFKVLNPSGELIIQIVNYDRILKENIRELPTINNPEHEVKFIRKYNQLKDDRHIEFITQLRVKDKIYKNSVRLLMLTKNELEKALINLGFQNIKFFGSFQADPWDTKSYATILRANKL